MPQTILPATQAGAPFAIGRAVEQPIQYLTDPRTGAQTIRRWRGHYQPCLNLVDDLEKNGWATDLHHVAGPRWELSATIGLSWNNTAIKDNPVDLWELHSNKVEKDFLNAQNALVASLTPADVRLLQDFLINAPSPPPATLTNNSDALSNNGQTAYELIKLGVKSVAIFQPVLKHTQTTSNIYAVQASFANVGQIISTSTLLALLPTTLSFTLPPDPAFGKEGFAYGWLVNYPQVNVSAFNKTQIIQDYEFGLYNTTMYNTPI